jgi:amino acid transporter
MASEKNDTTGLRNRSSNSLKDEEFATAAQPQKLHRQLKNRHVAMIRCVSPFYPPFSSQYPCSIGGVIGTGLFVGTATSLANGGPVGLLLGYVIMGTIVLAVMVSRFSSCGTLVYSRPKVSLGEMIAYLPIAGGHIKLAERFVNPALSFAMGWNYWYNWVIVGIFIPRPVLFLCLTCIRSSW